MLLSTATAETHSKPVASQTPTPIIIRSIVLEGNTLITDSEIEVLFEQHLAWPLPKEGLKTTPQKLRALLEDTLSLYYEADYRGVAVYIPPSSIQSSSPLVFKEDVLIIKIVEARINGVDINYRVQRKWAQRTRGDSDETQTPIKLHRSLRNPERWLQQFAPATNTFLTQKRLQGVVDRLQRHPGRTAAAVIKAVESPSEENPSTQEVEGAIDIELRVIDSDPITLYMQFGNTGSQSTKEERVRLGFVHQNLMGRDDIFSLDIQAAAEEAPHKNYAIVSSYDAPLWNPSWRGRILGSLSEFKSTDILGPGTAFLGDGFLVSGQVTRNVLQRETWFVDLFMGLDYQNSKVNDPFREDSEDTDVDLIDLSLGASLERNKSSWKGSLQIKAIYNFSEILNAADDLEFALSRRSTEPGFFLLRLSGSQSWQINEWFSLLQVFGALYTNERLVSARELSIGGLNTIRGYKEFEVLGDRGVHFSSESRVSLNSLTSSFNIPFQVELTPLFIDMGAVENVDPLPGENSSITLLGLGFGGRVFYRNLFFARLYWGYALRAAGNNPDDTKNGDSRLHFEMTLRY